VGDLFDTSEVDRLAIDMSQAPKRMQFKTRSVMKRAALGIKIRMQDEFSGHRQARAVPASLEMQQIDALGYTWEIGELDSAGPQWGLAAILAYGTSNNAPVADHTLPLREETPLLEKHLGDAAEDSILRGDVE
jgi:hypothetical protein